MLAFEKNVNAYVGCYDYANGSMLQCNSTQRSLRDNPR